MLAKRVDQKTEIFQNSIFKKIPRAKPGNLASKTYFNNIYNKNRERGEGGGLKSYHVVNKPIILLTKLLLELLLGL